MRRLFLRALILSSFVSAAACGNDPTIAGGGGGDGETLADGGKGSSGGKKDGGTGSSGGGSNKDGGTQQNLPPMLKPTSEPFMKDATGSAGLPSSVIDTLKAGGASCSTNVLYPYDKTVFPAGLVPPTIMWDGSSDAAYLKLAYDKLDTLDYQTAAGASDQGQLTIDPSDWNEIVRRTQGSNLLVTLTTKKGSTVSTCQQTWTIAQGAMVGSIFFNTYDSPDNNGQGAVVRLTLGQAQSEVYLRYQGNATPGTGPCISCHSVSANGASLAASLHNYTPLMWSYEASSYTVTQSVNPAPLSGLSDSTFGAFTPDGTRILSIGNPDCTNGSNSFPRSPNNFPLVKGPSVAQLNDTSSGQVVPANGLDPSFFMWMPQFSPKGDMVAFNHAKIVNGKTDRRELAVMKFDAATNTFSGLDVIVSNQGPAPSLDYAPSAIAGIDVPNAGNNCNTNVSSDVGAIPGGSCTGPCYPAWPFFTPDGEGLIYSMVSEPDFMSAFPGRDKPSQSELWYVDVATHKSVRLDTANKGLGDDDSLSNYYPTMLPVQVGGYYWMFWTSTRPWGHKDLSGGNGGGGGIIGGIFGNMSTQNATKKRIWVSAIKPRTVTEAGQVDISDTSSPGFYLEGQSDSGNVRAFATLNPCQQEGSDCTSGLDCCTGFCNIPDGADKGSCVPEKTCSDVNEKCKEDSDCCPADPGKQPRLCLGDYCGFQAL